MRAERTDPGSFRDPSGFVFHRDGAILRQVNEPYREHYDHLLASGLYETLTARGLLIEHRELEGEAAGRPGAYKVLQPRRVDFLSYPYEWCFGQLQAAALATLEAQKTALEHGMTLKDASAYNVQLQDGRPLLIDTLSFERLEGGKPWVGYRQFCQHFLAPLAVTARVGAELGGLLRANLDGVPLDLASRLLPRRTWLRLGLLMHVHLHARSQRKHAGAALPRAGRPLTLHQQLGLVDNLRATVAGLAWRPPETVWGDYYAATSYSAAEEERKAELVERFLGDTGAGPVVDLGANTGRYSRIAAASGRTAIACDFDPVAVEKSWRASVERGETRVLPLLVDLCNPSPALGWAGRERASWIDRFAGHTVMALALVHHLAIANNVPLPMIAGFLADLGKWLIIEFVPKSDPQVARLLASREDVFADYSRAGFEAAFADRFTVRAAEDVGESGRRLYLMQATSP